jgi:uncharacterized membrane protein YphA (DoxX/SURF4 family)
LSLSLSALASAAATPACAMPDLWEDRKMITGELSSRARGFISAASIGSVMVSGPDALVRGSRRSTQVAILTGIIFFFAGLVKFVFHHWELSAFQSFGLPWPSVLEIVAGVLETVGGVLLVVRRWVAPVAVLLAITMVVAIGSSGIGHGDVIPSLTLAPALLVGMLYLLVVGFRASGRPAAPLGSDAIVT